MLPLVDDIHRRWKAGWCTHALEFARLPDVEFFCGGVNSQTPTSAALWRQGNLLHYGFEQSPDEMNESGRNLLLNAIAYISRFTEDRPISITPSVFAGPVARSRTTLARWLRNPEFRTDFGKDIVTPVIWEKLSGMPDREAMARWAEENGRFLHPDGAQRLTIDEDLVALNVPFDQPEFFARVLPASCDGYCRPGPCGSSAEALRADRARRRVGRRLGPLVEGESGVRLRLRCRRLSLVHRSAGEETRRSVCRAAGPTSRTGKSIGGVMIQGLRTVIYPVDDITKGKEWYAQVTGRAPYFDEPFYVGFSVGGFELG